MPGAFAELPDHAQRQQGVGGGRAAQQRHDQGRGAAANGRRASLANHRTNYRTLRIDRSLINEHDIVMSAPQKHQQHVGAHGQDAKEQRVQRLHQQHRTELPLHGPRALCELRRMPGRWVHKSPGKPAVVDGDQHGRAGQQCAEQEGQLVDWVGLEKIFRVKFFRVN